MLLNKTILGLAFSIAILLLMLGYFRSKDEQMIRVFLKLLLIVYLPITIMSLAIAIIYPSIGTVVDLACVVWGSLIGSFIMTELTVHIIGLTATKLFMYIDQRTADEMKN